MAVTGISNLVLFVFSLIVIVFFLTFLTPFLKGITDTVGAFLGANGAQKLATGIYYTVKESETNNGVLTHYYHIILGRGFYYIGIWQSATLSPNQPCQPGQFCVVYISPTDNATAVLNAVKTGDVSKITVIKSAPAFYTGDYKIDRINGEDVSNVAGVLVYVDGIKSTIWGVSSLYVASDDGYYLSITVVKGASFIKVVKK